MLRALGIDLGNTKSVMAYMNKDAPKILDNQESENWTPSVVFAEANGEFLVGKLAKASGLQSPENMIFSIRQFMGRDYDDEQIKGQIQSQRFPYRLEKDQQGEVIVGVRDRYFSPPEVSAIILESLKLDAESSLGEQITDAIITVPAYFGSRQKEATRLAGRLAGLNVLAILTEPNAAALAYGVNVDSEELQTVLVYDLGGGTFDATILSIGAGKMMDMGKSGDIFLGGDDFNNRIVDRLIKLVQDRYKLDVRTLPNRHEIILQMKYKAEDAKIRLSRATRAQIIIPGLIRSDGKAIDLEYNLERSEFNTLVQDLVKRSIDIVYDGLKKANITMDDIDLVLLVGGSTRIPLVEQEIRKIFGKKIVQKDIDPMLCVAQGAAIQTLMIDPSAFESKPDAHLVECKFCGALNLQGRADCRLCAELLPINTNLLTPAVTPLSTLECPKCSTLNSTDSTICKTCGVQLLLDNSEFTQKLAKTIGIEGVGGELNIILTDDMSLPTAARAFAIQTTKVDQQLMRVSVFEGNNPLARQNHWLGIIEVKLPPGLPDKTLVNCTIQADKEGTIQVTANLPSIPDLKIQAVLIQDEEVLDELQEEPPTAPAIIKISHPYNDTPYEILSVLEDPSLGILPLDANLKEIKARFPLLNKWWTNNPESSPKRSLAELAKALDQMGFPGRVLIDAFLCTTLEMADSIDELILQQEHLSLELHNPQLDVWENNLEPWQAPPSLTEITPEDIPLSHQHHYDNFQIDLIEVHFDS